MKIPRLSLHHYTKMNRIGVDNVDDVDIEQQRMEALQNEDLQRSPSISSTSGRRGRNNNKNIRKTCIYRWVIYGIPLMIPFIVLIMLGIVIYYTILMTDINEQIKKYLLAAATTTITTTTTTTTAEPMASAIIR